MEEMLFNGELDLFIGIMHYDAPKLINGPLEHGITPEELELMICRNPEELLQK